MTDRIRTLVACDRCGRGYPARELAEGLDGELWCQGCRAEVNEQLVAEMAAEHDCDTEYRASCGRCNGVGPMEVGRW